jgi:hypothetical protein
MSYESSVIIRARRSTPDAGDVDGVASCRAEHDMDLDLRAI